MPDAQARPRPSALRVRPPVLTAAATLVQALLASLFYALVAGADAFDVAAARVIVVTVVTTGLVVFAFAVRFKDQGPNQRALRLSIAHSVVPWMVAPACAAWLAPPSPAGWATHRLAALVVCLGLAGLLVGQFARRAYPLVMTRALRDGSKERARDIPGASLAANLGRLLTGLVAISVLLAAGVVILRGPGGISQLDLGDPSFVLVLITFAGSLMVAGFAGTSVGRSPGRDVRSIARRLDALGYDASSAKRWPVAVTSFDDLGRLFQELENLRRRLYAELQRYQDALDRTRDADHIKANFLAAVSHELRTPLNSIEGYAQLLLEGTPDPMTSAQQEDVRLIRAGARQLLGLINDILDISMIESGELSLSFGSHGVGAMIREVVDIHQPLVLGEEKTLVADYPADLPVVICDRRRVGQVLNNLVSNAIKFTEVGSITVRAAPDPDHGAILVRVIDTGVGIPEEELGTIFEEFRQVGELKRRVKGTGLGLAIARSIARAHGGDLWASSEPGVGSTFTLRLPLHPDSTPEKIDVTEARVRAAALARQRTGKVRRYTDAASSLSAGSLDDSADSHDSRTAPTVSLFDEES